MITPKIRAALQSADGSIRQIARQFGVNPKTVEKWRKFPESELLRQPSATHQRVLREVDEWRLVRFRMSTALALDDCLYASQSTYPWLTRSTLYRCFRRYGLSQLSNLAVHAYLSELSPIDRLGVCSFYVARICTDIGLADIYAITDHATKLSIIRVYRPDDRSAMTDFKLWLNICFPFPIKTVLLIEDSASCGHHADMIEGVARVGAKIEVLRQPLALGSKAMKDIEYSCTDTQTLTEFDEMQATIREFLIRFNFDRKILQIGGLRPAEAAERYCNKPHQMLRKEGFAKLVLGCAI